MQVGQPITFTTVIEVPPDTGTVVAAEWDFEGEGTFPVAATWRISVSEMSCLRRAA